MNERHDLTHLRRRAFFRAHELLQESAQSLHALLDLQRLLVSEICRAEAKIAAYKKERKTLSEGDPRAKWLIKRIEGYRQLNYVWRLFGDGAAFARLDKYSIKQAFYRTTSEDAKQDPGFLSGKDGLASELHALEKFAGEGLPGVLSDLTNSIRYGDICLLFGPDPYFIEVKSSGTRSRRRNRQISDIRTLHSFYENDTARGLRGHEELTRVAAIDAEVTHVQAFNDCISRAETEGRCLLSPEDGLYYGAVYRGSLGDLLSQTKPKHGALFNLNDVKNARAWSPYSPFTLSIRNTKHLFDFVRGQLWLLVAVDLEVLRQKSERRGAKFSIGGTEAMLLEFQGTERTGGVSAHFISRLGFEFTSLEWMANHVATTAEPSTATAS